jgi:integrase
MRVVHKPTNVTHSYRMFAPTGRFKSFRIKQLNADRTLTAVDHNHPNYKTSADFRSIVEALDGLNLSLKNGSLSLHEARLNTQMLIEQLYRLDGVKFRPPVSHKDNQRIADDYMNTVIKKRKSKSASKLSARHYVDRAVRAIGEVSLRTDSIETIQEALDAAYPNGDRRQRQLAMYLNCLLKFIGREGIKIEKNRMKPVRIKYLTEDQFSKVVGAIAELDQREINREAFSVFAQMAFHTGMRAGELMGLERQDLIKNKSAIRVMRQVDTLEETDEPKWHKTRVVAVYSEAIQLFDRWIELKSEIPHEVRLRASRILKDACRKTFPKSPDLWICFHDLRHSFAIRCLEAGLPIQMIARQLGNTVSVCERYYVGFIHTDQTLEDTVKLMNRKSG